MEILAASSLLDVLPELSNAIPFLEQFRLAYGQISALGSDRVSDFVAHDVSNLLPRSDHCSDTEVIKNRVRDPRRENRQTSCCKRDVWDYREREVALRASEGLAEPVLGVLARCRLESRKSQNG